MDVRSLGEETVLVVPGEGALVTRGDDALDFIGDALGAQATAVAIPVSRLHPDVLVLSTRIAGDFIQKFTNYRLKLAIVGDISEQLARSEALRAFVIESNRGRAVRFVDRLGDLADWRAG